MELLKNNSFTRALKKWSGKKLFLIKNCYDGDEQDRA